MAIILTGFHDEETEKRSFMGKFYSVLLFVSSTDGWNFKAGLGSVGAGISE